LIVATDPSSVSTEIINFLDSAPVPKADARCPECGALMEHRNCLFIFAERAWDVLLPVCPVCHPVPPPSVTVG